MEMAVGDAAELAIDRIVHGRRLRAHCRRRSANATAASPAARMRKPSSPALQRHFLRLHRMRSALDAGRSHGRRAAPAAAAACISSRRTRIEQQCRSWSLPSSTPRWPASPRPPRRARLDSASRACWPSSCCWTWARWRKRACRSGMPGPSPPGKFDQPTLRLGVTVGAPIQAGQGAIACKSTTSSASATPSSTSSAAATTRSWREHGCSKGSMQLVDARGVAKLYDAMGPAVEISGGSVANTMAGVASFGGKAGFIGKTARGPVRPGVRATTSAPPASPSRRRRRPQGSEPTGRCLILVTPDGQRTMNTFLGVSPQLGGGEIDAELIRSARIVYLEGYLFDRPEAKAAFRQAAAIAGQGRPAGGAQPVGFVLRRPAPRRVPRADPRQVDILFANEAEITSLYQTTSFDEAARARAGRHQARGHHPLGEGQRHPGRGQGDRDPAAPVAKVVDTTGAGDLYAAGFLFGVARGLDLETAGRLGSLAAAEIISHIGARPESACGAGAQGGPARLTAAPAHRVSPREQPPSPSRPCWRCSGDRRARRRRNSQGWSWTIAAASKGRRYRSMLSRRARSPRGWKRPTSCARPCRPGA